MKQWPWLLCLMSALAVAGYVGVGASSGFIGFPLDDAWIHQTYARNLAYTGQLAFIPGQPSAGSTSLLWSVVLALGYALQVDYRVWAYGVGGGLLALTAWLVYQLVLQVWPERRTVALIASLAVALEWHLIWAAASGMETLLFVALALAVFIVPPRRALMLGLVVGLSVLARPDGLSLLPFALMRVMVLNEKRWQRLTLIGLGFLVLFAPYLAFNYQLSGDWWPNTFAAKQAEYAIERERPLWLRLVQVGGQPLIGAQILLLPGLLITVWQDVKTKRWPALLPLAWAVTFLATYSLRLPVIYQHGRYAMPVIPIVVAWGINGISQIVRLRAETIGPRLLSRVWVLTIGAGWLAFWWVGADAYRTDVQIIETEMVATAHWIREHTPPTALIAAHDIGALGYWAQRDILDLAGLISPDVIPFIRDETHLPIWLTEAGAQYLVIFPDWYRHFPDPDTVDLVFQTTSPYSPQAGGTNMAVYRWLGQP